MPIIKAFQGKSPSIHPTAFIAENAVLVGNVTIHASASIWYNCVLRGDVAPIVIGEGSNIQDGTVIHVASQGLTGMAKPTVVGKNCTVGHMALLHACTLEDEAFVGMQACLLDGSVVQAQAMLGAGSLLTGKKIVPTGFLWAGRPAKQLRELTPEEVAFLAYSAEHYQALATASKLTS
ncbi:MAG: gamma carbonic anhydrase family protein [Vampirovibrio sp.]|nr:gamma carbonic anhydrase family protein [Vampirovibrio sp.]